jgi:hypothetical protein
VHGTVTVNAEPWQPGSEAAWQLAAWKTLMYPLRRSG